MFTGLITDLGRVRSVRRPADGAPEDRRFWIDTAYELSTVPVGASIACSGACLTVVALDDGGFAVDVSGETLSKTKLGDWDAGTPVNLERALRLGDELGGHLVSGHVDTLADVVSAAPEGGSWRYLFEVPAAFARYIAPKGSVALDGVSLTVNDVEDGDDGGARFGVNIIPHTRAVTTFGALAAGDRVNLEIDLLARYVARLSDPHTRREA
jgi:riboflavin synthase